MSDGERISFMDDKALYDITYGLYIITVRDQDRINGQIANTVFQVTAEPKTITVCINKENLTHEMIMRAKRFGVCILSTDTPMDIIGLFGFKSGRDTDKFAGLDYINAQGGSPIIIDHCLGYLECNVKQTVDVGTHTMFIGDVIDAMVFKKDKPLTYAYYHEVKKGTAPKTAPTYRGPEEEGSLQKEAASGYPKYRCPICGYIYDPAEGDEEHGIKPGTSFNDLPEDWTCPLCRAPKSVFTPV
jgi:flavin reductase (DIM6/NTAB) family NADH-FMN oxidoreductase RutF/rubredoxin